MTDFSCDRDETRCEPADLFAPEPDRVLRRLAAAGSNAAHAYIMRLGMMDSLIWVKHRRIRVVS
ncbi:hypothetical protein EVC45_22130 [Paraburkholderia sp. UYCP14C]|uniref:hypothetical protein n=1 Tax=Paraburkholderia sp. UYCP14C TaxID=2511130 RepID=UPI00102118B6|nr:hypothetical protein [Paraburkholderia sp. UYCP14C]RZF27497.1 hypothetical protein EVC45_22130 [Paraburkholderia sp. UYCP14C]